MIDPNNEHPCLIHKYWQHLPQPTAFLIMMVSNKEELSKKAMPLSIRQAKTAIRNLGYFLEDEYRLTKFGLNTANLQNNFVQLILSRCCDIGIEEAVIFTDIPDLTKKLLPSLAEASRLKIKIVDVNDLHDWHSSEYVYHLHLKEDAAE